MNGKRAVPHSAAEPDSGRFVRLKHEDVHEGSIRCPMCQSGMSVNEDGCSLQACKRNAAEHPGGGWYYFCYHCRNGLGGGRHCDQCPLDNNRETRLLVQKRRNNHSRRNPIIVEEQDD